MGKYVSHGEPARARLHKRVDEALLAQADLVLDGQAPELPERQAANLADAWQEARTELANRIASERGAVVPAVTPSQGEG